MTISASARLHPTCARYWDILRYRIAPGSCLTLSVSLSPYLSLRDTSTIQEEETDITSLKRGDVERKMTNQSLDWRVTSPIYDMQRFLYVGFPVSVQDRGGLVRRIACYAIYPAGLCFWRCTRSVIDNSAYITLCRSLAYIFWQ